MNYGLQAALWIAGMSGAGAVARYLLNRGEHR